MKALVNARALTPEGFKDKQSILIRDGMIVEVCDDRTRPADVPVERDLGGRVLLPGFIDTQVNGGAGVLFNDTPTVDGIKAIGAAHRRFGTTGFLPTLISDDLEVMAQAIDAVETAIAQGVPGVLGIHLEGPFLNEKKRGVHDASKFRAIDEAALNLLSSLKGGKTLVTLAPENTTPDMINALHQRGVIVAAGHSLATYDDTTRALDAGLTGFTHLFNAMTPLDSRQPGIIAAALEDPRSWCGIIADGYHVHPAMLRLALRAKVGDQVFLVTDAMPSVGAADKAFSIGDIKIEVADGKCVTNEGTLAGSDLDMIGAVRNAMEFLHVDLEQATRMASILPARFITLQDHLGEIRAGLQADFVLLSAELEVEESWIKGQALSA